MTAIEYSDPPTLWQAATGSPQKIVIQVPAGRFLEAEDLAAGRIDPFHDRANGTVLAGGIHRLKYQQHCMTIIGKQRFLQTIEFPDRFFSVCACYAISPDRELSAPLRLGNCHHRGRGISIRVLQTFFFPLLFGFCVAAFAGSLLIERPLNVRVDHW